MRIAAPGPDKEIPLWDSCGAQSVQVDLVLVAGALSARGADGRLPHLRYRVGNAGASWKQITATTLDATEDKIFRVDFDCGIHHLPWSGPVYLVGGAADVPVDLFLFETPPITRADSFQWPTDIKTATPRSLTTLIADGGTMTVPRWHNRIGAWVTRAGTTIDGVAVTLGPTPIPCVPGSVLTNPAGASLLVFTTVTF